MENINTIKEHLKVLLDKTEDKEMIESLSKIDGMLDEAKASTDALEKENKELLKDYKELIKHTSFKTDKQDEVGPSTSEVTFESIFCAKN